MKISNQLSKLALVTYALVGIGVLGWSGVGVGEDYAYTRNGEANKNGEGQFPYSLSSSSPNPNPGPSGEKAEDKSDDKFVTPSTPTRNDSQPPVLQDPSTGTENAPSRGGLCSMECTKDIDCGCASEAGGEKLVCCIPKGGDAIGERGTCKEKKQCDGSGNDGDNPQDPSNPTPTPVPNNNKCEKDADCNNFCNQQDNNEYILIPRCSAESGQCRCDQLQKYQCRNQSDCATWFGMPSRERSTGCDSAENFKCEGVTENGLGECICQSGNQSPSGESCAGKKCAERCDGCKYDGRLSGACTCVKSGNSGTLVCVQADLPRC